MARTRYACSALLGGALTALAVATPAIAELEINHRLPCPHGACVPNRMTFGYYPTRWRRWPVSEVEASPGRGGPQAAPLPETSEPPPTVEDEIRSPFERVPRVRSVPEPGTGAEPAAPEGEAEEGLPRQPPETQPGRRIFQPPRGNPLPTPRRPIEDDAGVLEQRRDRGSVEQPPRRLTSSVARRVSHSDRPAELRPSFGGPATVSHPSGFGKLPRQGSQAVSAARSSLTNPLRSGTPAVTRPAAQPVPESPADEGPEITPTAAWIEELRTDPPPSVPKAGTWRRNPLRAG
jgi:hypothetical protein